MTMRFCWVLLLLLAMTVSSQGQEIVKVTKPPEVIAEVVASPGLPKELEGLQWNRWTSKNFTVVALNDAQAQYLHKHLEMVKGWCLARWGLYDIDFSAECKVIGVDSPALFKKLFNLDSSRVEVRRDSNGKIKESVIFLLMNDSPSKTVPVPLTEVCLAEFAQKYDTKVAFWAQRGMGLLNGSLDQLRGRVIELKPYLDRNDPIFFSSGLMEMDFAGYQKLDTSQEEPL
jgi:hypothetical protein